MKVCRRINLRWVSAFGLALITHAHGAIPAVGWPAMKMGFSAKLDLLKGISVGDKVNFEAIVTGNAGEVTHIKKR